MSLSETICPVCGYNIASHMIRTVRVTKKFVYVELTCYSNDGSCEFLGMIISD